MVTCTIEIQKGRHKQMRGHVQRKHKNYSNKDIDLSRSHYNETVEIRSRTELIHEHYKERQEELDKNRYEKGTKEKYRTPENYQALERNNNEYRLTAQVGDKEFYEMLRNHARDNGIDEETLIDYYSAGFGDYIEEFEERTQGLLKLQQVTTHFDEATPHIHMDVFAMGKTKKGHPSSSFDRASLAMFPDVTDTRERMSLFREQEDEALLKSIHKSMRLMYMKESNKAKNPPFSSKLERKTLLAQERGEDIEVGVEHEEYKRRKLKEEQDKVDALDQQINDTQAKYDAKKIEFDQIKADYAKAVKTVRGLSQTDLNERAMQAEIRRIQAEYTPDFRKQLEEEAREDFKESVDLSDLQEEQQTEIENLNELHKQEIKRKKQEHQDELQRLAQEHKQKVYETREDAIVRYELNYTEELEVRYGVEADFEVKINGGTYEGILESLDAEDDERADVLRRSAKREKSFEKKTKKYKEDYGLEI